LKKRCVKAGQIDVHGSGCRGVGTKGRVSGKIAKQRGGALIPGINNGLVAKIGKLFGGKARCFVVGREIVAKSAMGDQQRGDGSLRARGDSRFDLPGGNPGNVFMPAE